MPFPLADGETGVDLYIQQDRFREVFAADVAPEVAELMAAPANSMRSNRARHVLTQQRGVRRSGRRLAQSTGMALA